MDTKNILYGAMLLEVGKHIHPREITKSAVLENSQGSLIHVWGLDDGETVTLTQNPNCQKAVIKNSQVLIPGESSWRSWQSTPEMVEIVISKALSSGYRVRHTRSENTQKTQLALLGNGAAENRRV